jgi:hypothetical protein
VIFGVGCSDVSLGSGEPSRDLRHVLDHQAMSGAWMLPLGESGAHVEHHTRADLHPGGQLDHVSAEFERHGRIPEHSRNRQRLWYSLGTSLLPFQKQLLLNESYSSLSACALGCCMQVLQ